MKTKILTRFSLAVILAASAFAITGCNKGETESFGQPISDKTITPIKSIATAPADYNGKTVTVKGKIILECPAGGWFDLQEGAALLHVDLHPTGFAIPQKVGSIVTAQGTIKLQANTPMLVGTGVEIK